MFNGIKDRAESGTKPPDKVNMSQNGNNGVGVRRRHRKVRWRNIGKTRVRAMPKLDESKVKWMVREKRKGTPNRVISETLTISVRWIQKITKRYEGVKLDQIVYPMKLGRPKTGHAWTYGALCDTFITV